jgi:co-chaperonin GroES (HSP10)
MTTTKQSVIIPAPNHLLVEPSRPEKHGTFIIPENPEDAEFCKIKGRVLDAGHRTGDFEDFTISAGDMVIYSTGIMIKVDGVEYAIVKNEDIVALIRDVEGD